jgi:carbamoyltransferase
MEFGPRALGNRSILADPRHAEMKDILNARVKHRESFRPFAPAILLERLTDYFELDHPSPHMLLVSKIKPDKVKVIPAVCHVDDTGRGQTVSRSENELFYDLIADFEKITGVPVVLNTSFNVRGEPIVNRPSEAFACFVHTDMDTIYLGSYRVEKSDVDSALVERPTFELD